MIILFLYILLYLYLVTMTILSIKSKKKKMWYWLFSGLLFAVLNTISTITYTLSNHTVSLGGYSAELLLCLVVAVISILPLFVILLISIAGIIIQIRQKKLVNDDINGFAIKRITILKTFVIIILILLATYWGQNCIFEYRNEVEVNRYNTIRKEEISKMVSFINNKYRLNLQIDDCIYYREEDYTRHSDILGNGSTYNIPYIAVFKFGNEKITVVDRKGFMSDNKQLKDLNKIISDYFSEKAGVEFDFVEFGKSYVGSWNGNDNIINTILQTKFNTLITNETISEFIDAVLEESDLSIKFYIKDNDNTETLINDITKNLQYLKNYSNIEIVQVYGYNQNLIINNKEIDFPNEHRNYGNSSNDYYDSYKFGCYYIDADSTDFTYLLTMKLDRGYSSGIGQTINGWTFKTLK